MTHFTTRQEADSRILGTEANLGSIRERFGGADLLAGILGMFAALGVLVLLGSLLAAGAAGIPFQLNAIDIDGNLQEVEVVGSIVAILVILASFIVGGMAAGRIARYDGAINGVGAALWFILLVAVFAALGAWVGSEYNAFAAADLPNWFGQVGGDDVTLKAIAAGLAGAVAALLGGYIGGVLGEQYHKRVDAAVVSETANR
jgi:hypothetical protein